MFYNAQMKYTYLILVPVYYSENQIQRTKLYQVFGEKKHVLSWAHAACRYGIESDKRLANKTTFKLKCYLAIIVHSFELGTYI